MITAIDTNILLDILIPNDEFCGASAEALEKAVSSGSLAICDIVYAELCVHFEKQRDCDAFPDANEIRVQALRAGIEKSPGIRIFAPVAHGAIIGGRVGSGLEFWRTSSSARMPRDRRRAY